MSSKNPEKINNPEQVAKSHSETTKKQIGGTILEDVIHSPEKQAEEYRQTIEEILDKPLTPETFDGYVDNALNEVISVADDMIATYLERRGLRNMPVNGEVADSLVESYGISIDEILDDLQAKSDEIIKIKKNVESINKDHKVYIPPDSEDYEFKNGEAEYTPKEIVPKIETILFMLQQNHELNVENPKDIKLISGTVRPEMMRGEPYVLIDIPKLNRIILACNEKGNITYVFDQDKIKQAKIPLDKLVDSSKKQLDEIIKDFENIGIRIHHTSKYLPKIEEAMKSIEVFAKNGEQKIDDNPHLKEISLLHTVELAPDDVLSARAVSKELNVDPKSLKIIAEDIGEVKKYRFGRNIANGYTPEQVEMMRQKITPIAPENTMSAKVASRKFGVSPKTIEKIAEELGEELGEVKSYRFGSATTKGYTPEQLEMIMQKIIPIAPENILSATAAAKELGVDYKTFEKIAEGIGEELGEIKSYRFGSRIANGYTPEQVKMLRQKIIPIAPENTLSAKVASRKFGVSPETIEKIVEELGEELGEVKSYRFGSAPAKGYTPEQLEMIIQKMKPIAPENIQSLHSAATELSSDYRTIRKIAEGIGEELGEVKSYRFGSTTADGYTPEQIEIIKRELEKRKTKKK